MLIVQAKRVGRKFGQNLLEGKHFTFGPKETWRENRKGVTSAEDQVGFQFLLNGRAHIHEWFDRNKPQGHEAFQNQFLSVAPRRCPTSVPVPFSFYCPDPLMGP